MFKVREITYLATLTTTSVAIIIVLSVFTPFGIYPDIRISFEGVLIKLTGYLFGPIFGIISGGLTEFLLLLFRPGILHWAYTLAIILYGLFGGLAYWLKKTSNPILWSSMINSIFGVAVVIFMSIALSGKIAILYPEHETNFFSIIDIPNEILIILVMSVAILVIIYSVILVFWDNLTPNLFKLNVSNIGCILFLCILTEFISILLISYGNSEVITTESGKTYSSWMVLSLSEMPLRLIINVIVIYSGWKILEPLIKLDKRAVEITSNKKLTKLNWFEKEKLDGLYNFYFQKLKLNVKHSKEYMIEILKEIDIYKKLNSIPKALVTGTNGKGTTSHIIARVLRKKYRKIGIFTSPHLLYINERIAINSKKIPPNDFLLLTNRYKDFIQEKKLTFFESIFLVSCIYFVQKKCDFLVLECGIGAKEDSTNIFSKKYGIITSISIDHEEILGKKISSILENKIDVLTNSEYGLLNIDEKLFNKFSKKIKQKNPETKNLKELIKIESKDLVYGQKKYLLNSSNLSYAENFYFALEIARIENIKLSNNFFQYLMIPGRFEINQKIIWNKFFIGKKIIYDVAHNEESIKNFIKNINKSIPNDKTKMVFFSCLEDKKPDKLLEILKNSDVFKEIITTKIDHERATNINSYKQENQVYFEGNWKKSYKKAIQKYDYVFFVGSFYFIAEVKKSIK